MTHLENNATARTNLGVVNLAGVPATVEVELFAADGTALGDVVIALARPRVRRLFEITGLTQVFRIFDDVASALKEVRG